VPNRVWSSAITVPRAHSWLKRAYKLISLRANNAMYYPSTTMTQVRTTSTAMSTSRTHRHWFAPAFGYNYFATKSAKAEGFGTWSSIG
jgi:hypothetical protein